MAAPTGAVHFTSGDAFYPDLLALLAPYWAIAVPYGDRCADERQRSEKRHEVGLARRLNGRKEHPVFSAGMSSRAHCLQRKGHPRARRAPRCLQNPEAAILSRLPPAPANGCDHFGPA